MNNPKSPSESSADPSDPTSGPWWRYPHMWMVIGGPLIVVVAGLTTYYIAARDPDPVLKHPETQLGDRAAKSPVDAALSPAQQARNHAATGGTAPDKKP